MNCSKFFVSAGYAVLCGFMLALPAGATTRYVATNGSDSNACTTSSRCLTFNRAYQLSAAGDIVLVAAGSYSAQTISRNPAITGPFSLTPHATDVTIKPESGPGTVTVNDIDINDGTSTLTTANFVQHITFEDMTFTKGGDVHGGACIHFVRTTHRFTTFMNRASFVSYQNADIGGHNGTDGMDIYQFNNFAYHPNNILLEGNIIHDIHCGDAGCHPDAVATWGVDTITLRGNKFWDNDCINYRGDGGDQGTILFENNMFGAVSNFGCGYTVQVHGAGAVVRFNTFEGNIQNAGAGEAPNQRWTGNIILDGIGCPNDNNSGVVSEYNVWGTNRPVSCGGGSNNTQLSSFVGYFVNLNPDGPTGSDLRLTANATAAIDKVPLSVQHPATDFAKNARPAGSSDDAGAFEFGAAPPSGSLPPPEPPTNLRATVQ